MDNSKSKSVIHQTAQDLFENVNSRNTEAKARKSPIFQINNDSIDEDNKNNDSVEEDTKKNEKNNVKKVNFEEDDDESLENRLSKHTEVNVQSKHHVN